MSALGRKLPLGANDLLQRRSKRLNGQEHRPAVDREQDKAILQVESHGFIIDRMNHQSANAGGLRDLEGPLHRFA